MHFTVKRRQPLKQLSGNHPVEAKQIFSNREVLFSQIKTRQRHEVCHQKAWRTTDWNRSERFDQARAFSTGNVSNEEKNRTRSKSDYLDAALHGDHRRLSGRGGDGDCAHLVVEAIAVFVVNNKMEDVRHRLASSLQRGDVPANGERGCFFSEEPKLTETLEKKRKKKPTKVSSQRTF